MTDPSVPIPAATLKALLAQRPYALMWLARTMGNLATQIQSIALAWQVYAVARLTGTVAEVFPYISRALDQNRTARVKILLPEDARGEVLRFDPVGDNRLLEIRAPEALARYIARKGSITVNGVSLTTNRVTGACFTINLIPHTVENTALSALVAGSRVNLEIDLIARYVERMLTAPAQTTSSTPAPV